MMAQSSGAKGRASSQPRQKLLHGWGWEDASLEIAEFPARGRVLAAAGSGEVAALLASAGLDVDIVDANASQLEYAMEHIKTGEYEPGTVERLIDVARALVRASVPGWSRKKLRAFLADRSADRRRTYWERHLDTRVFRSVLTATLGPASALSAALQRDFSRPIPPHFAAVLRARVAQAVPRHELHNNRFAHRLFLGEDHPDWRLPSGVADRITPIQQDALSYLQAQPDEQYDGISLSNLADGASAEFRESLLRESMRVLRPGCAVILRSFSEAATPDASRRAAAESSMLWGSVTVLRATGGSPNSADRPTRSASDSE
ncbi:hypothetical protein [Humidisolicoccus flavus]|uniref:hypothetical protein n=1 Tax=Humidisolicoccus flavus TaxID=3111414 RepID=UPI00324D2199